jgi:UDP-N-acetylglucosamine 2-epimerase (non-hydrolysing)
MKIAPLIDALNRYGKGVEHLLVHTGQHYDDSMYKAFFNDLGIRAPDIDLGVGSGSHAEQTASIMVAFEKVCLEQRPDLVIVVGDVNSTLACTITAKKLCIQVAHIEAGLRSGDMRMPEEINRLCTDVLCDYLFTTDRYANENLIREGVLREKIHFVGNVMIDTLLKHRDIAKNIGLLDKWGLEPDAFALLTLHRPSNVDDRGTLLGILEAMHSVAKTMPVIFPIHPRTLKMAETFGLDSFFSTGKTVEGVWITQPLGYLQFLHLNMNARVVFTDSGGLQEETTVLGTPCITLRHNTERPITCEQGTNLIVGNQKEKILAAFEQVLTQSRDSHRLPEKWDGKAAERIVGIILNQTGLLT